jgi:hypothetical protein
VALTAHVLAFLCRLSFEQMKIVNPYHTNIFEKCRGFKKVVTFLSFENFKQKSIIFIKIF